MSFDNPLDADRCAGPGRLRLRAPRHAGRARCGDRGLRRRASVARGGVGRRARAVPRGSRAAAPSCARSAPRRRSPPSRSSSRSARPPRCSPRPRAGEEGPQGRLHPHHLRHAHHHGAPDGLLHQARPQRGGGEDRRLGRDPRQDPQQGIRRRAHALADAARHHAGRRLQPDPLHHAGGREHQRPGHHARRQAQGQARSQDLEGLQVRRALRLLDAQLPAALLRGRARHRSRHRHPDPRRAAAGDGGEPARRQHRRLPRPGSRSTSAPSTTASASSTSCRRSIWDRHPCCAFAASKEFVTHDAEHLRGAAEGDHRRHRVRRQAREPQADRRGHRARQLPQPAGDGGGADPDRHLRRRSRQREDRRPTASTSIPSPGSRSRCGS